MNNTIEKTVLLAGIPGDEATTGEDTTVPMDGVMYFDGDEIPQGYELYRG